MQTVKIQYTVNENYVEINKKNIANVINELKALNNQNIKYSVYIHDDGKTFMHIAQAKEGEPGDVIGKLDAFKIFREGLNGNLEKPPVNEKLELIESSFSLF